MKNKIKDIIWVVGLGFCVGFVLLQFELIAYHQLVNLEYQYFYGHINYTTIQYKHQESVQNYIRWGFGKEAKLATAIFRAESGLRCDRISKTSDYGIAQINIQAHPQYTVAQLLDCKTNLQIAAKIYQQQGNFNAWVAYKNGSYKRYLN